MIRVLLVDDERVFARMARRTLQSQHGGAAIRVDDCRSARAALSRLGTHRYVVVIIDGLLPDMDGVALAREIRATRRANVGLMMLTGQCRTPEHERAALAAGFHAFMLKPFDPDALRARVVALARRWPPADGRPSLHVLPDEPVALLDGQRVDLTVIEWKVLRELYAREGVVPWQELLEAGWGANPEADGRGAVHKYVNRLRAKLGPGLLETVRGLGYRVRNCKLSE